MPFKFEYVTSAVSVLKGDGVVVHGVNDSAQSRNVRVVIYQNTGAGAQTTTDTGVLPVAPTWTWGLGYTILAGGEYWVRVHAATEFLVPKASFERAQGGVWVPIVTYRPGDFAVFQVKPRRRIW